MVECPVCGLEPAQGQVVCQVCGLPVEFFGAFGEVAEPTTPANVVPTGTGGARATEPVQPETADPTASPPSPARTVGPDLVEPPSAAQNGSTQGGNLPRGDRSAPKDVTLRIGRSLGIDVSEFEKELEGTPSKGSSVQRSRIRRELVHAVLEALIERYRRLCDRRAVLSSVMKTRSLDAELVEYRRALSKGELGSADEQRKKTQQTVESLEASLTRIRARLAEASQMMRALRELGGVAPQALRPVAEAVRVPREAEAGQIEQRLDQTNGFLWGLLVPRMNHEISKCLSVLKETDAPPSRTAPIRCEIDRMAEQIRAQKIDEALRSHRFVRAEMASLAPPASPKPRQRFSIDQAHHS
jgi:hypothetical protein